MKKKYYIGLSLIVLESIVSGAYTPVDTIWIAERLGLIILYLICALVDREESLIVISYLPVAMVVLSSMSIINKWQSIESDKLKGVKSDYVTSVKPPTIPQLPDCKGLVNWRKEVCDNRVEKLQLDYSIALREYNSRVINSESRIQTAIVELTLIDQLPILIYTLFICVLSFISFKATPEIETKTKKELPKQKIDTEKLVKLFLDTKGRTIETYCAENGIAVSSFKRWKKNYETRLKKSETKLRLIERKGA